MSQSSILRIDMAALLPRSSQGVQYCNVLQSLIGCYCDLIDSRGDDLVAWLSDLRDLLPQLQAAIAPLAHADEAPTFIGDPDFDANFRLFTRLHRRLGRLDRYWLEFDAPYDGREAMSGSLADDLTDIYSDLKIALRLFACDPEIAIECLADSYSLHWGRHLGDALRHLTALSAQFRLSL